jgi:RimJ/RimL family protein N-acetyltransferase
MTAATFQIRRAVPEDGTGTARVLEVIVAERVHSAIDRAWTAGEQIEYIRSLSDREALHVAFDSTGLIVGSQSLELYSRTLSSMRHVAQLGTFVLPAWRGRGIGRALFDASSRFAAAAGYRKIVIQVRASNAGALRFYGGLGFAACGRLRGQVIVDDREEDEIIMEHLLAGRSPDPSTPPRQ